MKRYLVFAFYRYYPCGGWEDFKSAHETLEQALMTAKSMKAENWHIVDIEDMTIKESWNCE